MVIYVANAARTSFCQLKLAYDFSHLSSVVHPEFSELLELVSEGEVTDTKVNIVLELFRFQDFTSRTDAEFECSLYEIAGCPNRLCVERPGAPYSC
jgi:hypothetical protein